MTTTTEVIVANLRKALIVNETQSAQNIEDDGDIYEAWVNPDTKPMDLEHVIEAISTFTSISQFATFCNINSWDVEGFLAFLLTAIDPEIEIENIPLHWDT